MRRKSKYYYTLEGMDGTWKLICATKAIAKRYVPQCGNEGICYKRKLRNDKYKKFVFMWQEKMSSFEERWGSLTVEEALELNKAALETCAMEATSECDTM